MTRRFYILMVKENSFWFKEISKVLSLTLIALLALATIWYTVSTASEITDKVQNSAIVNLEERHLGNSE